MCCTPVSGHEVVWNRRKVVYYAILLLLIFLGELLGEINYIIVRFLEYDTHRRSTEKYHKTNVTYHCICQSNII